MPYTYRALVALLKESPKVVLDKCIIFELMFSPWILEDLKPFLRRVSEDLVFYDTVIGTLNALFSNEIDPNIDE